MKNGKKKGKAGELEWAAFCREQGFDCRRSAQYCGNTGQAADVVGIPGLHMEVKRTEKLSIYDAIDQARRDSTAAGRGETPIVAHRKNYCDWLVILRAEDFFEIYKETDRGQI